MSEFRLSAPIEKGDIERLQVGDKVLVSGVIVTARDKAHKHILENGSPIDLKKGIIYHCGPIINNGNGPYKVVSAGPTTSARMSVYTPELLKRFNVKAIIGKGGMDNKTANALMEHKAVYLSAIGGAGALIADTIKEVKGVYLEEFGMPESMWVFQVQGLETVVTMDAKGNNLYKEIEKKSIKKLNFEK